jgi:hypothetical protein
MSRPEFERVCTHDVVDAAHRPADSTAALSERAAADAVNGCAIEDRQQALARCCGLGVDGPFAGGCAAFVDAAMYTDWFLAK